MSVDDDQSPHKVNGKLVLVLLLLTAVVMTILTAVLVGDDFDPLAKPVDSAISERDLVTEDTE